MIETSLLGSRNYLVARLKSLQHFFGGEITNSRESSGDPTQLILDLCRIAREKKSIESSWLVLSAIAGGYADGFETAEFHGVVMNYSPDDSIYDLLLAASQTALRTAHPATDLQVITNSLIVDVDFCAKNELMTGIQRVTRNTVRNWNENHSHELVAWNESYDFLRRLNSEEFERATLGLQKTVPNFEPTVMLLPVDCTFFMPEVPTTNSSRNLSALAQFTSTRTIAIGYDFIPVTSAVEVMPSDSEKFATYLSTIKYFDKVICISESAKSEFHGYNVMLDAQGLVGPELVTALLPLENLKSEAEPPSVSQLGRKTQAPALPLVLCVGTIEPRKNQLRILQVSEELWDSGFEFELCFVGNASPALSGIFLQSLSESRKKGRKVKILFGLSDLELSHLYDTAKFTVFISTHEGYGLPVAESIAHNTPVITSEFGSMAEIATHGNSLLVDPRDSNSLKGAMVEMLQRKKSKVDSKSDLSDFPMTWLEYAEEIWSHIQDE